MDETYYIQIHRSPPGEISENGCLVAFESAWLYTADSIPELLELMAKEWRDDRHLAG